MSRSIRIVPLLIMTLALAGAAQLSHPAGASDHEIAGRIAALSTGLHFNGADPAESAQRYAELGKLTDRVRAEVDGYVQAALKASEGSEQIQARLRTILADHKPNPEYGDLPFARVADLRNGRSLVVAYTLVRGPHDDSATIRGYRWTLNRFEPVGTTGEDFAGYNMFKAELRSPFTGELWLLAWGQAQTYNGKKVRFRVYAFDGQDFRTVWHLEDMFNAALRITDSGFVIDHEERYPPYEIHDEYRLTVNGPIKSN